MLAASTSGSFAQKLLKQDPSAGAVKCGEKVLVDDGSCGIGQIKQVIGGCNMNGGQGGPRQTSCIADRRKKKQLISMPAIGFSDVLALSADIATE